MAQSNRTRPGRAGRKRSGGSRLGGERSGFRDGQADPETGGRRQSPVGTRGTVVRWSRCMGYPSGGSRDQWREPQRMAWLNGSYHGGQWRPLRTFLQLTRAPSRGSRQNSRPSGFSPRHATIPECREGPKDRGWDWVTSPQLSPSSEALPLPPFRWSYPRPSATERNLR